ncbi:ArnT family glycosyltransferase [Candidatus Magnetominusculus xianensis]|nr:hypothetical protein [Candidatus Magnetominusculus xianensis]MBF0402717.1 glycosyltransferase family 39 protein [Nitrospirota bacterium]
MNYYSGILWASDSAIFVNIAHHMINGKLLYRELWEDKQPMVFVVNYLALKFGDGTFNSVRLVERYFAVAAALVFFISALRTFASSWLAAIFTVTFLLIFYDYRTGGIFDMGNLTEEYGSVFMIIGVLFVLEAVRQDNLYYVLVSGIFFSFSVFTKEPFFLSALPWMIYLFIMKVETTSRLQANWKNMMYFAAGAAIPLIIALTYFISTGIFRDWLDVFDHNVVMARERQAAVPLSQMINKRYNAFLSLILYVKTVNIFFTLGVLSIFQRSFLRTNNYIPVVLVSWFTMSFIATNIQGSYGHYYIMMVPAFIMTALCGAAFLVYNLRRIAGQISAVVVVVVLFSVSLLTMDYTVISGSFSKLKYTTSKVAVDAVSEYIKEHTKDSDTIWVPSYNKYIYLQSGRLSPTKYLFLLGDTFLPTKIASTEQKMRSLRDNLTSKPPKFIFLESLTQLTWLQPVGIPEWFYNNYILDSTWYDGDLYINVNSL